MALTLRSGFLGNHHIVKSTTHRGQRAWPFHSPGPFSRGTTRRTSHSLAANKVTSFSRVLVEPPWKQVSAVPKDTPEVSSSVSVEEVICHVREALCLASLEPGSLVQLTGTQDLMEMPGRWEFTFAPSGEFSEAFVGPDYASMGAYDGSTVWEADVAGRIAVLDLDDYEVCLLTAWLRTGHWVDHRAKGQVQIRDLEPKDWDYLEALQPPFNSALDFSQNRVLAVSLSGKKTIMYVSISPSDWLPTAAILNAYGTSAWAKIDSWTEATPDVPIRVAWATSLLRDTGDFIDTSAANVKLLQQKATPEKDSLATDSIFPRDSLFAVPSSGMIDVPLLGRPMATLDLEASPEVEAIETPTGHILVRPLIDGREVGYFILDTGASTLTIEPDVADKLGMPKFGCVNTVTVNGPAKCSFRSSDSFSLGPLSISRPRYVDVAGAALAERGLPVVGICGFDVFRHSLVYLCRGKQSNKISLRLLDPSLCAEDLGLAGNEQAISWLPIRMLSSTPHMSITFQLTPKGPKHSAMFLLDTGAAGTDLIFNSASTREFELLPPGRSSPGGGIMRGMGGDGEKSNSPSLSVSHRSVAQVTIAPGVVVKNASAIVMAPEQNGLQLSCYTSGLICQNLLAEYDLIFDYARCRVGLITKKRQKLVGKAKSEQSKAQGG